MQVTRSANKLNLHNQSKLYDYSRSDHITLSHIILFHPLFEQLYQWPRNDTNPSYHHRLL